jgi:hypothetical protein
MGGNDMKRKIIAACLLVVAIPIVAWAVANVNSKWSSGNLLFYDGATSIMTIKSSTSGVQMHQAVEFDGTLNADAGADIDGGLTDIGTGTYTAANGDNDLGVVGDVEIQGTVYLDDASGASPNLTFVDATDETAVFGKADSGNLTMTIGTTDSLQVLTGNLRVGNGTPGVTMDGEDAYVEGTLEVDGLATLASATITAGTVTTLTIGSHVVVIGSDTVANGATSKTVTVANTDTDDYVFVTANETPTNTVTLDEAIPGTGSIAVHVSGDPGASNLTFSYLVLQD